jgi:hypothetical protein
LGRSLGIFVGEGEPLLTSYHYYVGCGNEVHNAEDKLTEISALQQGVEVIRTTEFLVISTVPTSFIYRYR